MVARSSSTLEPRPGEAQATEDEGGRELGLSAGSPRPPTEVALDEPTQAIPEPPPLPRRTSTHLKLISGGQDFDLVTIADDSPSEELDLRSSSGSLSASSFHTGSNASVSSARAFGSSMVDVPVPPAPKLPRPPVELRREESVISDAQWARQRPWARASTLAGQFTDASLIAARRAVRHVERAVSKFERLPRTWQIAWIAIPYLGALILLMGLLLARGSTPEPEEVQPIAANAVVEVTPVAPPPLKPTPQPAAIEVVPEPEPPEPELSATAMTTRIVVLADRAKLFMRPSTKYDRLTRLRRGTELTIYEDFGAPKGWVLARTKKGTVGYLRTRDL